MFLTVLAKALIYFYKLQVGLMRNGRFLAESSPNSLLQYYEKQVWYQYKYNVIYFECINLYHFLLNITPLLNENKSYFVPLSKDYMIHGKFILRDNNLSLFLQACMFHCKYLYISKTKKNIPQ